LEPQRISDQSLIGNQSYLVHGAEPKETDSRALMTWLRFLNRGGFGVSLERIFTTCVEEIDVMCGLWCVALMCWYVDPLLWTCLGADQRSWIFRKIAHENIAKTKATQLRIESEETRTGSTFNGAKMYSSHRPTNEVTTRCLTELNLVGFSKRTRCQFFPFYNQSIL
jgi:hypothetical protein